MLDNYYLKFVSTVSHAK